MEQYIMPEVLVIGIVAGILIFLVPYIASYAVSHLFKLFK